MNNLLFLIYLGVIVWAIVPIRQFKTKYFFYFLFWVSADIATLLARLVFHSGTNFFYAPCSFLALCALLEYKYIKKYLIPSTILFIIICAISIDTSIRGIPEFQRMGISICIIHLMILLVFLKQFITAYIKKNLINIFLIILIFSEIMTVTKFLNYLTGFTNDYLYYNITNSFEIIFGVFFVIFKADNKRLIFQFK